jgi:hypothetical protein
LATTAGGRELPGRLAFVREASVAAPALAALLVLATRIPLRTHYLLNWDAAQFALGIAQFDVVHHQPHPPGYLVYIAAGRLLLPFFRDANSALVALSIFGECAAVVLAYLFAREVFGEWAGVTASLALAVAPLFWFYGEAANTYALEPATVMLVAWPCWRLWHRDAGAAVPAGLGLALAGAIRPSTAFFLLPLVGVALWRGAGVREALVSVGAAAGLSLGWVIPMIILSGGLVAYLQALLQLGVSASGATAIWSTGLNGLATLSVPAVMRGIVWELGAFAIVLVFGLAIAPRLIRTDRLPRGWLAFLAVWALPALVTFVFIHIGQVVYVQVFLPALLLPLGPALRNLALALGRPQLAPALLALCLAANVTLFLLPPRYSLAAQLQLHDARVAQMVTLINQNDPDRTLLVTDAQAVGAYREAQIYTPAYHRLGVASDRKGRLGEIFGDTYEPWRLKQAQPLQINPGVDTYVFLDPWIVKYFVADPERLQVHMLADGTKVYVWHGSLVQLRSGEIWVGTPYQPVRGLDA